MEQRPVGRSGMRVPALTLSTATWGTTAGHGTDVDSAAALFSLYRDAGGTLLNLTAGSEAETMAGRLIGRNGDGLLLASRAGWSGGSPTGAAAAGSPGASPTGAAPTGAAPTRAASTGAGSTGARGSRSDLLGQLDASLRRIGVEHLDLWQVPVAASDVPFEETLAALDHAVDTGRVRYVGVADHGAWRLARAATWQRGWPGRAPIVSDQVEYSLLSRGVEHDVVPAAAELGVGILAYGPLAGGALVGRGTDMRGSRGVGADLADRGDPRALGIVEAVATAADGLATTAVAVAVSWLRDRPGVTSVVVGARTIAHLTTVLQAQTLVLPTAIRHALDDVSVPHHGYDEPSGDVS